MKDNLKKSLLAAVAIMAIGGGALTPAWADGTPRPNQFWWPDKLDLSPLRHDGGANP